MKLVTYNIQFSRGKDNNLALQRCIEGVRGADIIALQEVERHWNRSGMTDQPALIGDLLPDYYWVYGPSFDVHAAQVPSEGRVDNRRRQFGDMLLSKTPIISSRVINFPKTHHKDRFNLRMGAMEATLETVMGPICVLSVHLGYLESAERIAQLRCMLSVLDHLGAEQGAWSGFGGVGTEGGDWSNGEPEPPVPNSTILLGDFNMLWNSPEYQFLTNAGYHDAWVEAGHQIESGTTVWPGLSADIARNHTKPRIDYCFVTGELRQRIEKVWIDDQACGSDHFPVWTVLAV